MIRDTALIGTSVQIHDRREIVCERTARSPENVVRKLIDSAMATVDNRRMQSLDNHGKLSMCLLIVISVRYYYEANGMRW